MDTIPWTEKYRPKTLDGIVGNEAIVQRLRAVAASGTLPHLLLTGPPGVGKTTSIVALAGELLNHDAELMREAVLELNASDERGIDVVRGQIKAFASKKVVFPPGAHALKIIILDEADSMTPGAQQALRRIMEMYSATTRFALACNTSAKVIEPIQSRCAILRYGRIPPEAVLERLVTICKAENVEYTPEGLAALVFVADGDVRAAVNALQATVVSLTATSGAVLITHDAVVRVCDTPNPGRVRAIVDECARGNLDAAQGLLDTLLAEGHAVSDVLGVFFRVVRDMRPEGPGALPEHVQLAFIRAIGVAQMRALEGVATPLQLSAMLVSLCLLSSNGALLPTLPV